MMLPLRPPNYQFKKDLKYIGKKTIVLDLDETLVHISPHKKNMTLTKSKTYYKFCL